MSQQTLVILFEVLLFGGCSLAGCGKDEGFKTLGWAVNFVCLVGTETACSSHREMQKMSRDGARREFILERGKKASKISCGGLY